MVGPPASGSNAHTDPPATRLNATTDSRENARTRNDAHNLPGHAHSTSNTKNRTYLQPSNANPHASKLQQPRYESSI